MKHAYTQSANTEMWQNDQMIINNNKALFYKTFIKYNVVLKELSRKLANMHLLLTATLWFRYCYSCFTEEEIFSYTSEHPMCSIPPGQWQPHNASKPPVWREAPPTLYPTSIEQNIHYRFPRTHKSTFSVWESSKHKKLPVIIVRSQNHHLWHIYSLERGA